MQNQNNKSFFDKQTILAVIGVMLVFFGWQSYIAKKYPNYNQSKNTQSVTESNPIKIEEKKENLTVENPSISTSTIPVNLEVKKYSYSSDAISFNVVSLGMGLTELTINKFLDKDKNKIIIGDTNSNPLFAMRLVGSKEPLIFEVVEKSRGHYFGVAKVGETIINRELVFDDVNSSFTNTISIISPSDLFKDGFSLVIPEAIKSSESKSFLFPSYSHQDFLVTHDGKTESLNFSSSKENFEKIFTTSSLISVGSQYFTALVFDKSLITPEARLVTNIGEKSAFAEVIYKPTQLTSEMRFQQIFYAGPKSIDTLKAVDPELTNVIDFGFFGAIGQPLLYIMKAFNRLVNNWGFSIILLTLLVRFCVLPFNLMSAKSMKAMQKVQPQIQSLREKFKDEPVRLNQEMMAVMKANGANPMGGCLPMLVQIPVFFALYRVIGSSVELYNSPFIGWIHDLSAHDPFFVLPILMAAFMFIQQKITPSTMDPAQAKVMLFLPLIFSVFMLQLPAGLTLYMVVSTLFGIVQQYFIMRDSKAA